MATTIDYVSDWAARLRSRLYEQYHSTVTWNQWVDNVLGPQFQDLEDAGQSLLTLPSIDDSVGAQLDVIGRIVGQSRLGFDDPTYRMLLKARVLSNRSTGTTEDIYKVMLALFGAGMIYVPGITKQFSLRITSVLTVVQAVIGASFLGTSKEAGARGVFEWQEAVDASMFAFATPATVSTTLAAGATAGVTSSIQITDPVGFPTDGGNVVLDVSTALEETVTYAAILDIAGQWFLALSAAVARTHAIGCTVDLVNGTGIGFGDASDTTIGGQFAGAVQA